MTFVWEYPPFSAKANLFIKREKDGMGKKLMYTHTSLKWFSFVSHLPQGSEQRYFKQQKPLSWPQHHEISLHSILDEMPFSAQDCILNRTKEKGERGWLEQWDHPSGCNLSRSSSTCAWGSSCHPICWTFFFCLRHIWVYSIGQLDWSASAALIQPCVHAWPLGPCSVIPVGLCSLLR